MVNGKLTDLKMKIGDYGECFFVHEVNGPVPRDQTTSPITTSPLSYSPSTSPPVSPGSSPPKYAEISSPSKTYIKPIVRDEDEDDDESQFKPLDEFEEDEDLVSQDETPDAIPTLATNSKWTSWFRGWGKGDASPNTDEFAVKENKFIEQKFLETLQNRYHYDAENDTYLDEDIDQSDHSQSEEQAIVESLVAEQKRSAPKSIASSSNSSNHNGSQEKLTATLPENLRSSSNSHHQKSSSSLSQSPSFENFFENFENGHKQFQKELNALQEKKKQKKNGGSDTNGELANTSPSELSQIETEKMKETNTQSSRFSWNSWLWYSSDTDQTKGAAATTNETAKKATPSIDTSVHYQKSLRPVSSELKSLNLVDGRNEISFLVTSRILGTQEISAEIYLWNHDDNIVISDVDGTITRSDALGHILPMFGKDWSHVGITELYKNIHKNGYRLMYLTSRSIIQSGTTKRYLRSVVQNGYKLPDGPMVCSPGRLFECLTREVILRKPEEFKIAALKDIKTLFIDPLTKQPYDTNDMTRGPFYAGFGNRITDLISYRAVAIPTNMIFTVDHTGKIVCFGISHDSYTSVNTLLDYMFPGSRRNDAVEFNDFNFWRMNLDDDKSYLEDLKK
jgi:phosphatidate phosphatase PAH1